MVTLELHGTSELGVGADVLVVALFAGIRVPKIIFAENTESMMFPYCSRLQ
jgi:hypothetical protein